MAPNPIADMNPPAAAPDFLIAAGWEGAEIRPLAGDASFRRYFRVVHHDRSAILMDAPPPHEDPRPFISIARWLTGRGFAAPAILAENLEHGLVLLEDFGDARLRETVDAAPESELRLYEEAVDLLIRLGQHEAADIRDYARRISARGGVAARMVLPRRWGSKSTWPAMSMPGTRCSRLCSRVIRPSRCCAIIMPRTSC
jgi:hypothetical protein